MTDPAGVVLACSVRDVYVGRDDRAAVLACFDDTAAVVFTALCELCAGDAGLAVELLGETYTYLARIAASSYGVDADRRWMIDAAHSVYGAHAPESGHNEIEPVASLTPAERVIVHLHDVDRRGPSEIALLLGATIDDIERSLTKGRSVLAPPGSGTTPADAFRRCDVWFDDTMRTEARARIGGYAGPPPETDRQHVASADDPARVLMSRRTMVGAGATASIAALIGLGLWFGSSGGDGSSKGNELPEPPATTRTTSPTTTAPDTTPTEPSTTDDTTTPGNDTTTVVAARDVPRTGFIIDPVPDGFAPAGGFVSDGNDMPFVNWFQLWTSPDATRTTGRWMAINVSSLDWNGPTVATAEMRRAELGARPALMTTEPTGIMRISTAGDASNRIELSTFGLALDVLSQLVGAMGLSSAREPTFSPAADSALDGLDLRISRPGSSVSIYGFFSGDRNSQYMSPDGGEYIDISAGPQQPGDQLATALLGPPSTDPTAIEDAPTGSIDMGGRHILVFSFGDQYLQWHDGDYTVTMSGNLPLGALLDVAAHTRLATDDEWAAQQRTYPTSSGESVDVSVNEPSLIEITQNGSSSATGVVVRMGIEVDASGQRSLEISAGDGTTHTWIESDPSHPITVFLDIDVTIIVADLRAPGPQRKLRVSGPGLDSVFVPLVPLGDTGDYGAAYAFSEITDFTVALVDADGTVIQEYDV